jgi:DNA-binding transcriptional LysR family regulator
MDLTSLEIFRAVAAERSVTHAARLLGRVPSNVSTRLQQLEQQVGAALFARDGKRMVLTREGETFLAYADRILALAAEAKAAVRPAEVTGPLRVGTMESTAASRLPQPLAQFHARWPSVSLQLSMGATSELTDRVISRELDCALIARVPDALDQDRHFSGGQTPLHADRVFVEDLLVVLPAAHPAIESAADLEVDTLAALEPGCTYRRIAEDWGRKTRRLQTLELGSYHAILASVASGTAAGVIPKSVLDLLHWPAGRQAHRLAAVDTLLIRRKDYRSDPFDAFLGILQQSGGSGSGLST